MLVTSIKIAISSSPHDDCPHMFLFLSPIQEYNYLLELQQLKGKPPVKHRGNKSKHHEVLIFLEYYI
jgi:hypothetical protein